MGRFDRNIQLFGAKGQTLIRTAKIAICGLGGLGSIVNQQCALLGVREITQIDHDDYSGSNRNRLVGYTSKDPLQGVKKVDLAARLATSIDSRIVTNPIPTTLVSAEAFAAIRNSDYVFGCLDQDGPRFILNEVCMAYGKTYIDLATDVPEPGVYGGRVFVSWNGGSCLYCKGLLDPSDVRRFLMDPTALEDEVAVYGVSKEVLGQSGPSVVSINGQIASAGVTEFMVAVTGLRNPVQLQTYRADLPRMTKDVSLPSTECPYCIGLWEKRENAEVERYLN